VLATSAWAGLPEFWADSDLGVAGFIDHTFRMQIAAFYALAICVWMTLKRALKMDSYAFAWAVSGLAAWVFPLVAAWCFLTIATALIVLLGVSRR
jgi:hypothetical protein